MGTPFWRLRRRPKGGNSGTTFLLVLRHHFGEDDRSNLDTVQAEPGTGQRQREQPRKPPKNLVSMRGYLILRIRFTKLAEDPQFDADYQEVRVLAEK
jgi:hypothetical protein